MTKWRGQDGGEKHLFVCVMNCLPLPYLLQKEGTNPVHSFLGISPEKTINQAYF